MTKLRMVLIILVTAVFLVPSIYATNGYFSHGYGAKSKGMAGAGTALIFSTLDSVTNPGALVFLGKRFDVGVGIFMPNRSFTVTGMPSMYPGTFPLNPGTVESDTKAFLMPHIGFNFMLNENTSLGITAYGNGGMNTNYNSDVFHGSSPTGQNLAQLFVDVTLSRKLAENHAIGVTAVLAYQMFKAEGLEAFAGFSRNSDKLTNNDTDNSLGYGFRFGYMGKLSKYFSIGASYQTKVKMQEFDEYEGLFAEQGGFDIPSNFNIGIAIHPVKGFTVAVDLQKIMYSDVKSIATPFNPMAFFEGVLLGDDNGAGFGWEDVTVYKFGIQWETTPKLTLRAGFSTCEQPIPSSEVLFNILAPGVIEQHLTFGGTIKMANSKELTLYVMYAFNNTVSGYNPMEASLQQTIELEMDQLEFGLEFSF